MNYPVGIMKKHDSLLAFFLFAIGSSQTAVPVKEKIFGFWILPDMSVVCHIIFFQEWTVNRAMV
jgi:hypothetical protein